MPLGASHIPPKDPAFCFLNYDRHTNHHAAASLPFKFVPVPLGVAHDTNATRPTARTAAPPHIYRTHGARTGRDTPRPPRRASHLGSLSSRRRRWCVQNVQERPEMPRPPESEARLLAATRPILILKVWRLRFKKRVWWLFFIAMRPLAGPVGASIHLV